MPSLHSDPVRAYRAVGLFIGAALIAFVVLFRLDDTASTDALIGIWLVAAAAGALVAATFAGSAVHKHLRTGTYLLFLITIAVVCWLAYQSAFDVPFTVALVFLLAALGLVGSLSSTSIYWIGATIGVTVALPILGLLFVPDPLVDPWTYAIALAANGLAVFLIVRSRQDAHTRLEAEREQYQSLFDRAAEGIYLADAETLRILDANPAYLALTGRTLKDIRTLRVQDLAAREPETPTVEEIARTLTEPGSTFAGSHRHRTADGGFVDVDVSVSSLVHGGRPAFLVIVRDATAQRETERRLDDARERAEQLLHLKSALLSNMSHEVRTPLTGILGYAELLRHELTGEPLSYVEAITESAQRLHETLESLLDLAEVESGSLTVELESVDLSREAETIAAAFHSEADAKGLELTVSPTEEPLLVLADRRALSRTLRHLINNAIKFTKRGEVRIDMSVDGAHALLHVRDTGVGISEAFRPPLFESFQQASTGLKRTHQGAGLGLAIAKRLAESMHGTIDVESEEGVGSVFTIRLPLAPSGDSGMGRHQRGLPWPDSADRMQTDTPEPTERTS